MSTALVYFFQRILEDLIQESSSKFITNICRHPNSWHKDLLKDVAKIFLRSYRILTENISYIFMGRAEQPQKNTVIIYRIIKTKQCTYNWRATFFPLRCRILYNLTTEKNYCIWHIAYCCKISSEFLGVMYLWDDRAWPNPRVWPLSHHSFNFLDICLFQRVQAP